jgi:hypothetical protein
LEVGVIDDDETIAPVASHLLGQGKGTVGNPSAVRMKVKSVGRIDDTGTPL